MNSPEMKSPLSADQEQLIHHLVKTFLAPAQKGECKCHWIDAKKTPILAWKHENTWVLKISTQKFIGLSRMDKKGGEYWKFREFYEEEIPVETSEKKVEKEPEQVKNSQVPVQPEEKQVGQSPESDSAVEKFREKYGNFNQSQKSE